MAVARKEDYRRALDEQKKEVWELVMAGLEQIKEGNTKDFSTVCDRLEKKYRDEAISNWNWIRAKINSLVSFPEKNELDEDESR